MSTEKIAIYCRVSTQEQATEGYSIGEQEDRLRKFADAHGWSVYKSYIDPGFSGASTNRPALSEMIDNIKQHRITKVLVYKLDRLSRSQRDTLYLIEDVFLVNNVDFVSMTENFDTSSPLGRAMIGILSVFAQLEREQIKERMAMGIAARAKKGLYHGNGKAPIGYDYVDGQLVINPFYAPIVKQMFEKCASGNSLSRITKDLNDSGILSVTGEKWRCSTISKLLTRPIYIGLIAQKNGTYQGQHEAIIDVDTYNKVQLRLDDNKKNSNYQRFANRCSFVSGRVYCIHCGGKMRIFTRHNKFYADGTPMRYLSCLNVNKLGCVGKARDLRFAETIVLDELKKLKFDSEFLASVRSAQEDNYSSKRIIALKDRNESNNRKIKKLTNLYMIDDLDFDNLKEQIDAINREIIANETEIQQLEESTVTISDKKIIGMVDMLDTATSEEQKTIISTLIEKIYLGEDEVKICWKF